MQNFQKQWQGRRSNQKNLYEHMISKYDVQWLRVQRCVEASEKQGQCLSLMLSKIGLKMFRWARRIFFFFFLKKNTLRLIHWTKDKQGASIESIIQRRFTRKTETAKRHQWFQYNKKTKMHFENKHTARVGGGVRFIGTKKSCTIAWVSPRIMPVWLRNHVQGSNEAKLPRRQMQIHRTDQLHLGLQVREWSAWQKDIYKHSAQR